MIFRSFYRALGRGRAGVEKRRRTFLLLLPLMVFCNMALWSCTGDGEPIDKPDQFTHVYEAEEKFILRAIARTFQDRDLGKAVIHEETNEVVSDYVVREDWRIRSLARVRKISRTEREVTLSILTEKKTSTGWELRRLLGKEQYEKVFTAIETRIYQEMYKQN